MMSHYVFVYGTLKKDHRNHGILAGAEFVGATRTRDYSYMMHAFQSVRSPGKYSPGVFAQGTAAIAGELYKVDEATLAQLDELEDVGVKYDRVEVSLESGQKAYMYLERPNMRKPLPDSPYIGLTDNIFHWTL